MSIEGSTVNPLSLIGPDKMEQIVRLDALLWKIINKKGFKQ